MCAVCARNGLFQHVKTAQPHSDPATKRLQRDPLVDHFLRLCDVLGRTPPCALVFDDFLAPNQNV